MSFLIPLASTILPFLLWPVEFVLPFPFLIEEIAKTLLVSPLILSTRVSTKHKLEIAVLCGFLFAISETVLYLPNLYQVGYSTALAIRLLVTTPLHILTLIVIVTASLYGKKYIVLGFVLAVLIHYLFNQNIEVLL